MFLFILESIGTSELILIGVIALIVFGPRKLPQMMRTVGKWTAEFRKTTSDFKETWEREVDFENFKEEQPVKQVSMRENTIAKGEETISPQITAPEIKEVRQNDFEKMFPPKETIAAQSEQTERVTTGKQDWL